MVYRPRLTHRVDDVLCDPHCADLPEDDKQSIFELFMEQFDDTLVKILLAAAVISFALALSEDHKVRVCRVPGVCCRRPPLPLAQCTSDPSRPVAGASLHDTVARGLVFCIRHRFWYSFFFLLVGWLAYACHAPLCGSLCRTRGTNSRRTSSRS